MTATTAWTMLIVLVSLALGAAAGLWAGRRLPAERSTEPTLPGAIEPVADSLRRVESFLQSSERQRATAHGELREQVRSMHDLQATLSSHTTALVNALRAPHVRGRWGEMQLRRIVESSGMIDRCHFTEQHTISGSDGRLRPDLVVHLTGGRNVVVDAKVPFTAFIEAVESTDDAARVKLHRAHAKQVRTHLDLLAAKGYQSAAGDTPDFVVMFLPSDGFLQLALQHEPGLLERGFENDVVIATPTTLLALLRTVAHTWRQDTVSGQAQEILELGQALHHRLGTFAAHLGKIGTALGSATARYNDAVGSLERSVMPAARKMHDRGIARSAITLPDYLDRSVRELYVADPPDRADRAPHHRPPDTPPGTIGTNPRPGPHRAPPSAAGVDLQPGLPDIPSGARGTSPQARPHGTSGTAGVAVQAGPPDIHRERRAPISQAGQHGTAPNPEGSTSRSAESA